MIEAELSATPPSLNMPNSASVVRAAATATCKRPTLVVGQVEIAQLVAIAVDAVRRLPGLGPAEHLGLDRHTDVAQQALVALEGTAHRRMPGGILAAQLVDDVVEGQRDAGLEQQRQQVRRALQLIGHAPERREFAGDIGIP